MNLSGSGTIRCMVDKLNLVTGEYWIELAIRDPDAVPYDYKEKAVTFAMNSLDRERGVVKIEHTWIFPWNCGGEK